MTFNISLGDAITIAGGFASVVIPLLLPVADHLKALLASKLPASQAAVVDQVVTMVVHGMEQAGSGATGDDKRIEALRLIREMLAKRGIKPDPNHVEMALQQAVFLMNQFKSDVSKVDPSPAQPVGFQPNSAN